MKYPNWISAAWRLAPMVLMLAAAPPPAMAAPVIVGSGYSLYLNSSPGVTVVPDVRFDGVAENFTRTVTLADNQQAQVGFSVQEEQTALGNGDWMIRIVIDADADLYPTGGLVGFAFGVQPDDPLDLDGNWRLAANIVRIYAGATELAWGDWLTTTQANGQADPWDGFFISDRFFGAFLGGFNGRGVDRVEFEVQVSPSVPVPEPGSLGLVPFGLAACAGLARRSGRRHGLPQSRRSSGAQPG